MDICLIQVPYFVGDETHDAAQGPARMVEAGALSRLTAHSTSTTVERVERRAPFTDSVTASVDVSHQLAVKVRQALDRQQFPLIVAGCCDVSLGIVAAFDHRDCGVVWIDAHGDYNTPESSLTGFFGGMPLAALVGDCYGDLWSKMSDGTLIAKENIVLVGIRDLDPPEADRLEQTPIQIVRWRDGQPLADVDAALDTLATRVSDVYLHLDLDGLDPSIAPGVDYRVPGGLSLGDLEAVIRSAAARFRIRAVALTSFNPARDVDGRTVETCLRIVEVLAENLRS